MSPDFDVTVVRSVPLIERFENVDLTPAEMKSPGREHSTMVGMLLDVNAHFWSRVVRRLLLSASVQASWQEVSVRLPGAKAYRYLLTDPRQFDILQSGPG
jgi:hypothetical protein